MALSIFKQVKNNSDPGAVLEAGWNAMQQVDPRLAQAVINMPPQVAQQVVLQYTNAIRMGKEADASALAIDAARAGLSSLSSAPSAPAKKGIFGRSNNPYSIADINALDQALGAQEQQVASIPVFAKRAKAKQVEQAQQVSAQAFQGVKDRYNAYNAEGSDAYLWSKPQDKQLTVPTNWSLPLPKEKTEARINTNPTSFSGESF